MSTNQGQVAVLCGWGGNRGSGVAPACVTDPVALNEWRRALLLGVWHTVPFLPRDAMLARYMLSSCACPSVRQSIHLSVRPSQVGVLPRRLNLGSRKQRRTGNLVF